METQTRLNRHNKFISAENIVGIFSVSSDDSFTRSVLSQSRECGVTVRGDICCWVDLYYLLIILYHRSCDYLFTVAPS